MRPLNSYFLTQPVRKLTAKVCYNDRQLTCSSPKALPYLTIGSLQQSWLRQLLGRYYTEIFLKEFEIPLRAKKQGKRKEEGKARRRRIRSKRKP